MKILTNPNGKRGGSSMTNLIFDKGFAYIPVPPHSKAPIAQGWNERQNCITKTKDAYQLVGKNAGLATAYCDPPVVHLDIDDGKSAVKKFDERGIDLKNMLKDSGTTIFKSGRKGSLGALFTLPFPMKPKVTKVWREGPVVSFELRCATAKGMTCCSIIPPSKHPSGTDYEFIQGDLTTIRQIPNELLHWYLETIDDDKKLWKNANVSFDNQYETPRKRAVLLDLLAHISPDCSYPEWRDVVFSLLNTGWPCAFNFALTWSERGEKFCPDAFDTLVNSFQQNATGKRGKALSRGTLYYYARMGGYLD
jgi:hypothetical protein